MTPHQRQALICTVHLECEPGKPYRAVSRQERKGRQVSSSQPLWWAPGARASGGFWKPVWSTGLRLTSHLMVLPPPASRRAPMSSALARSACAQGRGFGGLTWAVVAAFPPWEMANATNQGPPSPAGPAVKHFPAHGCSRGAGPGCQGRLAHGSGGGGCGLSGVGGQGAGMQTSEPSPGPS